MLIQSLLFAGAFIVVFSLGLFYLNDMRKLSKINEPNQLCRHIATTALDRVRSKNSQIVYPLHLVKNFYYSGLPQVHVNLTLADVFAENKELLRQLEWYSEIDKDTKWQSLNKAADLEKFEEHRWPNIPIWSFSYLDIGKNSQADDKTDFAASLLAVETNNFLTALIKTYPNLTSGDFSEAPLLSYFINKAVSLDPNIQNLKLTFKLNPILDSSISVNELLNDGKYIWPLALTDPPPGIGYTGTGESILSSLSPTHPDRLATTAVRISKNFIKQRGVPFSLEIKVDFAHNAGRGEKNADGVQQHSCTSEAVITPPRRHHAFYRPEAYSRLNVSHGSDLRITISNMPALRENGVFPFCAAQWLENQVYFYDTLPFPVKLRADQDSKMVPCHTLKVFGKLPSAIQENLNGDMILTYQGIPPGGTSAGHSIYVNYFLLDWSGNILQANSTCTSCVCTCTTGAESCCPNPPWGPPVDYGGFWVGGQQFASAEIADRVSKETGIGITYGMIGKDDGPKWYTQPPQDPGILNNIFDGRDGFNNVDVKNEKLPDPGGVNKLIDAQKNLEQKFAGALDQLKEQLSKGPEHGEDRAMLNKMIDKLAAEKKETEDKTKAACQAEAAAQIASCQPLKCTPQPCSGCGGSGSTCEDVPCGNTPIPACDSGPYGNVSVPPLIKKITVPVSCGACPDP